MTRVTVVHQQQHGIHPMRARAQLTREGVRSTAHGPAHPMNGSQPRSWARRIFLNGDSSGAREGVLASSHAHAHTRLPARLYAHSVCCTPQVAICTLSRPRETSWVSLAQLRAQMQTGAHACVHVYGLLRVCGRSVIRPCCRCRVDFACTFAGCRSITRVHFGARQ